MNNLAVCRIWSTIWVVRELPDHCFILGWTAVARSELWLDHLTMVTQMWELVRNSISMCGQDMSDMTVGATSPLERNVSCLSDFRDAIRLAIFHVQVRICFVESIF
jgi:hypothetical protein